ncbi:MAG: hypothetical protein AB4911_13535 [Oscillochloridaceae bacterium umkhey_bin13]
MSSPASSPWRMINPFRPLGQAFRDSFDDALLLVLCNLFWFALCAPLWWLAFVIATAGDGLVGSILALFGVLPGGPASAGLVYVAYRISDGRASKVADFFIGMRRYARHGWLLGFIWMGGLVAILFNLGFWAGMGDFMSGLLLGLWLYLLIFWCSTLIYAPALVLLQEQPSLRLIARNTALMVVGRPFFTLFTLLLMLGLVLLSVILVIPALTFSVALLAVWGMRATMTLIDDARRRLEEANPTPPAPTEERGRKGQVRPK